MSDEEIKQLNHLEDETRKEILKDYTNNMLIEALAGAGKTTILISRLYLITETNMYTKVLSML